MKNTMKTSAITMMKAITPNDSIPTQSENSSDHSSLAISPSRCPNANRLFALRT